MFPLVDFDKVKEYTKGDPQWKIKEKGEYIFCSYRQGTSNFFPNPQNAKTEKEKENYQMLREIRGLIFESKTKKLVSRPFHKFFNLNENSENSDSNIDISQKHWVLEKLDGSMIQPILVDTKEETTKILRMCTKMGFDTFCSESVEEFLYKTKDPNQYPKIIVDNDGFDIKGTDYDVDVVKFCIKWILKGYSPIFEFCSPKCKIILDYNKEKITLLGLRNIIDGSYISYDDLPFHCEKESINYVKDLSKTLKYSSAKELISQVESITGIEGVVLRFDDGKMFKVKTKWYQMVHKSKMSIQWTSLSEGNVWKIVLDKTIDDVLPVLNNDEDREKLIDFSNRLWNAVYKKIDWIENFVKEKSVKFPERKVFFDYISQEIKNQNLKIIILRNLDKKSVKQEVIKFLKMKSIQKIKEAKEFLSENEQEITFVCQNKFF